MPHTTCKQLTDVSNKRILEKTRKGLQDKFRGLKSRLVGSGIEWRVGKGIRFQLMSKGGGQLQQRRQ